MLKSFRHFGIGVAAMAIVCFSFASLQAAVLSGSGAHLPIPSPNPGDPGGVPLVQVAGGSGFTGTWSAPAHPDWIGTVAGTGTIPASLSTGIASYDFSSLPTGKLPAGTIFIIGDVDGGSTLAENIDLTAFDSSGGVINLWLDEPIGIWGSPWPAGSLSVPGWDYGTVTADAYNFTGATVTGGNPSINVAMLSNQPIARLLVNKHTTHFGFSMRAPEIIPEPSTLMLLGLGAVCLMSIRSRRSK
jgi:hypothetical protein